jgi:hypothetical protein
VVLKGLAPRFLERGARPHREATSDSGIDWSWSPKCRGGGTFGFLSPFSEPLDLLLLIGEQSGFISK